MEEEMPRKSRLPIEDEWMKWGLKNDYFGRNPKSFYKSNDSEERSWYRRGSRKRWSSNFPFNRKIKPVGYWKIWENYRREMMNAISENGGEFPTQKRLWEIGYGSLSNAAKYYGNFIGVRKKMGYEFKLKSKGFWSNWGNFEKEMNKAIEENNGEFPSTDVLKSIGRYDLIKASRHYGGLPKVRSRMGYEEIRKPRGYWKVWSNFEKEMNKAIEENNGEFPSTIWLANNGYSSLASLIHYFGEVNDVRKRMGYEEGEKSKRYWKVWSNFEKEITKIINERGEDFFNGDKLNEIGMFSLKIAISKYYGGMDVVRARLEAEGVLQPRKTDRQKLENLLNDYVGEE